MPTTGSPLETLLVFLKLGVSCFGGPVAHLGYFHEEFVVRRKWLDDHAFVDIVALCQILPGPASSQVGMAIGMHRAGWIGALAAWIGFTIPSALLMIVFAYGVGSLGSVEHPGWGAGLKLAALAVVAQAVWSMASKFCFERLTASLAIGGAIIILFWSNATSQIFVIGLGALLGWLLFRNEPIKRKSNEDCGQIRVPYGSRLGIFLLGVFLVLFLGLPVLTAWTQIPAVATFASFYRAGSLVFGGGPVVLPLLQTAVVNPGWVGNDKFLSGYGAVQAVPGPLFSFSAYLGAIMKPQPNGWLGGVWCLLALYLPAALLVFSALPFWDRMRSQSFAQATLKGANAAVVGVLLAVLYQPVWTSAVHGPGDFIVGLAAYCLLVFWALPPWLVVAFSALAGFLFLS